MFSIEKTTVDFFSKKNHIISVDLFGSYAQNQQIETSDVDIGVLFEGAHIPSIFEQIEWREKLSEILKKDVDLICLNDASPIIGMQVYKNGKNLLLNDRQAYFNYQMRLFTDYAELKELRLPMEKTILKRKMYDRT